MSMDQRPQSDGWSGQHQLSTKPRWGFYVTRDVFFEFDLKFWNTTIIDIPVRSLL